MTKPKSAFQGRWQIVSMTEWDEDFLNAEVEAYMDFGADNLGSFQFGYVRCDIDWRATDRESEPAVEFSFEGMDEMEPYSGCGSARLRDGQLDGMIFFHRGDESGFLSKKK